MLFIRLVANVGPNSNPRNQDIFVTPLSVRISSEFVLAKASAKMTRGKEPSVASKKPNKKPTRYTSKGVVHKGQMKKRADKLKNEKASTMRAPKRSATTPRDTLEKKFPNPYKATANPPVSGGIPRYEL